jgi:PAS domain S-box-containing protein
LTATQPGRVVPSVPASERLIPSPPNSSVPTAPAPQALLAAIVATSDDAIISKTLDGIITSWNEGAQRIFGYTAEEAVGQSVLMLIPEGRKDEEQMILAQLRRGLRVDHYETIRVTKDGRLIDISLTISPIRNDAGELVGASKVARDITLQKRAQRELEDADARKNEFLALLAHELRNPLGPIRHAVKILRARAPSPDELEWATNIIDRQTEHMTRLVDDLLDVARITRGTIELRRERVDITDVLKAAVESSGALIERARHQLRVTPPTEPLYVEGDATRLTQIITNLLDNSAKYTNPGGRIWLTAEREGSEAVIRVKDTGIGITSDVLPRIFDMFTQAGLALERAQGGLGVGLALVDRLVKLHGGSVSAYSGGLGKGSQFTIRLPVLEAHRQAALEPRPQAERPGPEKHCRILVVDDNQDSADSLAMLLHMLGHEVKTANDGERALDAATEFRPDVAILDIGLPKMNGYDLAKQIREQPWARDVVLVALTGWGQEQHRRRSAESGFNHHLTKPVEFEVLQQILAAADTCLPQRNVAAR